MKTRMMDATFTAVARLHEQELLQLEIARRLKISEQKVGEILLTIEEIETEDSRLQGSER